MLIGHINLAPGMHDSGEPLINLVEALQESGVEQHVLVRNTTLARRLAVLEGVNVAAIVHTPIMAYCLLPRVDVLHVHELAAGQAGLLSALTRSIPYVLTHRGAVPRGSNPLLQAVYKRASVVVCQDDSEIAILRHWLPGLVADVVPDVERHGSASDYLRVYQNSHSKPIAGNNGIQ